MSEKTVEDEILAELGKFGSAARYAFQQWRRANPNATKVPRGVWKQMDLADRDQRWNAKIRLRQQVRAEGAQRKTDREALYKDLETRVGQHRKDMLNWHRNPGASYDQHMRRQWELLRDRAEIERAITTSSLFSTVERGQAVRALTSAHQAWRPKVKPVKVRTSGPLAGMAALKARAAERLSRIRLGITERGRIGHRPQPDRPAAPKTREQVMGELRHLIADRHEMAMNADLLAQRLRERGTGIESFAPDAAQMAEGHRRNLAALDREISDRITGSGMPVEDWLEVQFQLREPNAPERQAGQRWMERQSTWDLENRYRINSWDHHVDRVIGPDSLRRWDHDFPEREEQQRREFLNPPAGWQPTDPDATDRFMFLIDTEHNEGPAHVRNFGYPQSGYDWVQRKMSWIAEPHDNVNIVVWDRAVPLDANDRVRGFAIDSMQGLYANLDADLDRRFEYFRDLSMTRARDRSIPAELSVPGLEDLNQDRQRSWASVRASNVDEGFRRIHSVGESGRVWRRDEARYYGGRALTREQLHAGFDHLQRNALPWSDNDGWSDEVERVRFDLDHYEALTGDERARAREILTVTETEAKLGQRPDRDLWAAVVDRAEFDRWSGLETPGTPQRPQAPEAPQRPEAPDWTDEGFGPSVETPPWDTEYEYRPEPDRTDPLAHVRSVQEEMRNRAAAQPEQPQRPEAPEAPEAPAAPDGSVGIVQSEVLDKLERDLAEMTERAERAERERNTARGQRDEAVAKLVRRTPPEQRYGNAARRAAERPEAPEAPEAPAQPDREDLPHDRDEQPAYDRSDMTEAESVPDWSGIPEPPEPPEFEPVPSGHNGWDGFER
ncbi:hypothetical protein [Nocardia tengchongensis]|uniref:hypothetical protein n=1 Tax=Nocardia tengchongensis TaxID=2055889 RepID=UPI003612DA9D